jgi:hypothetical protein
VNELTQDEFERIYGPVAPLLPAQAAELFADAPFAWWICGGWSSELDALPRRPHEDLEVGIARQEIVEVRQWLADFHLWDIHEGTLRFLSDGIAVPDDHEQLWVRRDAFSPWLMDLMITPVNGDTWQYKRDRRVTRPMSEAIVVRDDGIPRQRPEITLLFKARRRLPRDEADFAAVVPRLSNADRAWLRDAILLTEPADNPWLALLERS